MIVNFLFLLLHEICTVIGSRKRNRKIASANLRFNSESHSSVAPISDMYFSAAAFIASAGLSTP